MEKWADLAGSAVVLLGFLTAVFAVVGWILSAKVSAAKDERLAAAESELRTLKEPRTIPGAKQGHMSDVLRHFAGQPYTIMVFSDPEARQLAGQIDSVLRTAEWVRVPSQLGDVVVDLSGDAAGISYDTGVRALVGHDNPDAHPALLVLADQLTDSGGIPCTANSTNQLDGKEPKAILVNVGKKPVG